MEWLTDRIKNSSLTQKERLVAEFFINNSSRVCFMTVTNIAQEIGISDSSVVRFAHSLGFSGFNELKTYMQQEMSQTFKASVEYTLLSPTQRMEGRNKRLQQGSIAQIVSEQAISCISDLLVQNSAQTLQDAVDLIISSRRKYITGFRTALPVCEYMRVVLNCSLPNVILNTAADARCIETLIDISPEDCLVLFAFSRYGKMNMLATDLAKQRGAKVVLITDKFTFPKVGSADVVLVATTAGASFFNSLTAPILLTEILCTMVSKQVGQDTETRMDFLDQYITPTELY